MSDKKTQDTETLASWVKFFNDVRKSGTGYPLKTACSVSREVYSRDEKFVKQAASQCKFVQKRVMTKGLVSFLGEEDAKDAETVYN